LKSTLNRDLSDDGELDRQGSTGQQLQTVGTDDAPPTTNLASSTCSIKLKSKKINFCFYLIYLFI
jgi:hypothetical protein